VSSSLAEQKQIDKTRSCSHPDLLSASYTACGVTLCNQCDQDLTNTIVNNYPNPVCHWCKQHECSVFTFVQVDQVIGDSDDSGYGASDYCPWSLAEVIGGAAPETVIDNEVLGGL